MQNVITFETEVLKDGHLSLPDEVKEQLHLKEGDKFLTSLEPLNENKENKLKKDPAYNLSAWAVDTGVDDLAQEHDHYLYGTPKKS